MSTSLWDRRLPRISYQVPVGIQMIGDERRLAATSVNLSAGGIFVDTDELLAIGSPVVLSMPLAHTADRVEMRGRVAWLRPIWQADEHRPRGMGIRFVDVDAMAVRALETIVGTRVEDSHPVVLEVAGSPQKIQARAQLTGEGIFLRTPLPFLRLGSNVRFSFNDDDQRTNYRGRIAEVSLHAGEGSDVPRLQVEVELTSIGDEVPAADMPQITWRHRPSAGEDTGPGTRRRHAQGSSPPAAASEQVDGKPREAADASAVPGLDPAAPDLDEVAEPGAVSEPIFETTERTRRKLPPLAIAAGVVGGATLVLALALSLGDSERAPSAAQEATGEPAGEFVAEAAAERAALAAAALGGEAEAPSDTDRSPTPTEGSTTPVDRSPAADTAAPGLPAIHSRGGRTTVTFRYAGDPGGMNHYVLQDPAAVAVNLPSAQPLDELGSHWIRADGVRLIWVRERLGGMHVRVFFQGDQPEYTVTAEGGELIIDFAP